MRYHEIMEKSEPNNPQLWGKAKAAAKRKYKVYPSAYANGFAAKWYKERGGTWKTVSESIEDMITEISRPETQREADTILRKAGYKRIGYGSFGAVYEKGDKVLKTFVSHDTAYLEFAKMAMSNQNNPHFPKIYGKPLRITDEYYGIKIEKLQKIKNKPNYTYIREFIINLKYEDEEALTGRDFYPYIKSLGKDFIEACKLIASILKKHSDFDIDIYGVSDNMMAREKTLVFSDPIYNTDLLSKKLPMIGFWESKQVVNEISRPYTRQDAVEFLSDRGYTMLGSGGFANVFKRKSRPNEVIKLFSSSDDAYEAYLDFIIKNQDNPHFPKVIGKPMLITPGYYAVKLEFLKPYDFIKDGLDYINNISDYLENDNESDYIKIYFDAYPKFKDALDKLKKFISNNPEFAYDIHTGNVMWRNNTLVLTDPVYNPDEFSDGEYKNVTEDLRKWFDEKWVDISRKVGGKHPPCGDSAGKGRRKKSNNAAYPKCVKTSKAKTMTKKEKESASRRKRNVEKRSTGKTPNMVKTDT